jgi:hypothetical protein
MNVYIPPKPAPLPNDFNEFYSSLTSKEKELHQLATEMLGSSYFIQWTHMYQRWIKTKKERIQSDENKIESK